jgi:hypothetical protein
MPTRRKSKSKVKQSQRAIVAGIRKPSKAIPDLRAKRKIRGKHGTVRKLDYDAIVDAVHEEMSLGSVLPDITRHLGITPNDFYRALNAEDPKNPKRREQKEKEHVSARRSQARAIAAEIQLIVDGRDKLSRKRRKEMKRLEQKLRRERNPAASGLLESFERTLIQRNRLQIDGRKWYAKVLDPENYGDRIDASVTPHLPDGMDGATSVSIKIEFVTPPRPNAIETEETSE